MSKEKEIRSAAASAAMPDPAALAARLDKYIDNHNAQIKSVSLSVGKSIKESRARIEELQKDVDRNIRDLQPEKAAADEKAIREEKEKIDYLSSVVDKARKTPVFSSGDVATEWNGICEEYREMYYSLLNKTRSAALEYKKAVEAFAGLHDSLLKTRAMIESKAQSNGDDTKLDRRVLTAGINADDYDVIGKSETVAVRTRIAPLWNEYSL